MNIRRFIRIGFLCCLVLSAFCSNRGDKKQTTDTEILNKAKDIHEKAMVMDTHLDIEVTFVWPKLLPYIKGDMIALEDNLVTLNKMEEGGLDAAFFAVYIPQTPVSENGFRVAFDTAMVKFKAIHKMLEEHHDRIELALNADDVPRILSEGKKVAMIGIENGYALGKDINNLKKFYDLGCRYITLCHGGHNQICDSSINPDGPEALYNGLSDYGKEVVVEMNRLGIIIDISHLSKKSMLDVLQLSKAPVIASHSSCLSLCNVHRNLDDEQLLALKENGGVINIVAINSFIKEDPAGMRKELSDIRNEFNFSSHYWPSYFEFKKAPEEIQNSYNKRINKFYEKYPPADIADFVDHIDHAVNLIGAEHVGISSDFFEPDHCIEGWRDASETFNITLELVKRGYSRKKIEQIWGGNLLRVWTGVKKTTSDIK
ncbi:dipeptidase [candidate division KSB1 bacterium]